MVERPLGIGAALAGAREQSRRSLLRNHGGGHASVSNLELFFDLVFVFAITQLSHYLLVHLNWLGVAQTAVLREPRLRGSDWSTIICERTQHGGRRVVSHP